MALTTDDPALTTAAESPTAPAPETPRPHPRRRRRPRLGRRRPGARRRRRPVDRLAARRRPTDQGRRQRPHRDRARQHRRPRPPPRCRRRPSARRPRRSPSTAAWPPPTSQVRGRRHDVADDRRARPRAGPRRSGQQMVPRRSSPSRQRRGRDPARGPDHAGPDLGAVELFVKRPWARRGARLASNHAGLASRRRWPPGQRHNLQAILDACADGRLPAAVVAVVSDRADAYALDRAGARRHPRRPRRAPPRRGRAPTTTPASPTSSPASAPTSSCSPAGCAS